MKTIFKVIILFVYFVFASCEKEDNDVTKSYLDSFDKEKYYSIEIIPNDYQSVYSKWKLFKVSGGFSGMGYEPDYDYLEIKSIGIYGLVRNDSLFEYGKIELDTFDNYTTDMLQIKIIPDFYKGLNPYMYPPEKYMDLKRVDTLDLISPCCDMYNYHFIRIK